MVAVASSQGEIHSGYREIARIEDPDGILAIISSRVNGPPLVTIGLYKQFDRDGETTKTSFWGLKQLAAVRRVIDIAATRAQEEEDKLRIAWEATKAGRR